MRGQAEQTVRLSRQQSGVWLLEEAAAATSVFNSHFAYRLRGALEVDALRFALDTCLARHEVLRTVVRIDDSGPVGVILPPGPVPLVVHDLGEPDDAELDRTLGTAQLAPFDVHSGPLLRADLYRTGPDSHALLVCCHHIACDGQSLKVLRTELAAAYNAAVAGVPLALPPAPQYGDYAEYQQEQLDTGELDRSLRYWTDHLAGAPGQLSLPADHPRPAVRSYAAARHVHQVGEELTARVRRFAAAAAVTPFMVFQAAFGYLLGRLADREDVVVGTVLANRQAEDERALGLFATLLPQRLRLSDAATVRDLLRQSCEEIVNAHEHQEVPFEQLLTTLGRSHDSSQQQLFQVTVQALDRTVDTFTLDGLTVEPLDRWSNTKLQFDLALNVHIGQSRFGLEFLYSTDLFEPATIEALGDRLARLVAAMIDGPDTALDGLPVLLESDRTSVARWNATERDLPPVGGVLDLIRRRAAADPEHPALVLGATTVTYGELLAKADRVAQVIVAAGVAPGSVVGVCLPRGTLDLAAVELGSWRAHCGYLVLNPDDPPERLDFELRDGEVALLVTSAAVPSGLALDVPTVLLEDLLEDLPDPATQLPPGLPGRLDRAYIVYTSGSTGVPKAVAIRHESVLNLVAWHHDRFGTGPADRMTLSAAPWFDGWVLEAWTALAAGATLVLLDWPVPAREELRDWLLDNEITIPHFTTALAETVFDLDWPAASRVRVMLCGGERLNPHAWSALPFPVYNGYGPTEGTVICTSGAAAERPGGRAPLVGGPMPNFRIRIVDARGRELPVGVPGEVCVAGIGLADGFWKRPDLTAERFVRLDLDPADDATFYRTGDIGRWLPGGMIEIVGRTDDQVKIRGFRIELGEVEAVLARHPAVAQTAVVVREPTPGDRRLIAYVGCAPDAGAPPTPAQLRRHLAAGLPTYMVPAGIVVCDRLPLTPNGKVDRANLPACHHEPGQVRPPRSPREEVLCGLFAEVLGVARVGVDDSFFDLGGHSLSATRLVAKVRSVLGVELDVRGLFADPTVAGIAARLDEFGAARPAIRRYDLPPAVPLSFAQQRLWFVDRMIGAGAGYTMPFLFRVSGELRVDALRGAVGDVVARHEPLRTVFPDEDGLPRQSVLPPAPVTVPVVRVAEDRLAEVAAEEAARSFDLATEAPLRVTVFGTGTGTWAIMVVLHHIAADGWSMGPLLRDLSAAYTARVDGGTPAWPALPLRYVDYTLWQRDLIGADGDPTGPAGRQLAFWRQALAGLPEELALPTDRPRPSVAGHRGASVPVSLPPALHRELAELARECRASVFMVVQAGVAALLSRLGAGTDVPIGVPVAGRTDVALDELVGFFVNTLVVRTDLSGDPSFRELVGRVRDTALAAYANQDVPFERLVEVLNPTRSLARHPLFQVMLAFGPASVATLDLPGLSVHAEPVRLDTAKFDLSINLTESFAADGAPSGVDGFVQYAVDLFDRSTVEAMVRRLVRLLEQACAPGDRAVSDLDLLTDQERHEVLHTWNYTAHPVPDATVSRLFERQVAATPDAPAVLFEGATVSYAELNARANRLARLLVDRGVRPGSVVALALPRSVELVVALLAVLKAGAAYLPIDPDDPASRIRFVLDDIGPAAVLAVRATSQSVPNPILLDQPAAGFRPANLAEVEPAPDDLAYVLYTSGSTGAPKAVGVPHRGLVNRLAWTQGRYPLLAGDRVLQKTPYGFDVSVWEFFWPLLQGAGLVLAAPGGHRDPAYLAGLIRTTGVTVTHFVPSMLRAFLDELDDSGRCPSLRRVICSGEVLPVELQDRFLLGSDASLHNLYGPTEASIDVTSWDCRIDPGARTVPIGRPIWNIRAYVLDTRLRPVPPGTSGRLYLAGAGLARGYLGRPALTAERFVPNPFGPPGDRMYDTGDLARWTPDGVLEFLGRTDQQVKVRGVRIELGEIESAALRCPGVRQAAAALRPGPDEQARLVLFVVPEPGMALRPGAVRDRLAVSLPEHTVPSMVRVLDELPLNTNGKLDRARLPGVVAESTAGRPPRSFREEVLAELFAEVLGVDRVDVERGFFHAGGHSLLATRLVGRIRAALGVDLGVRGLFQAPSPAALAELLCAGAVRDDLCAPLPLNAGGERPPLFCVAPWVGIAWCYASLIRTVPPDIPLYGLHSPGFEGPDALPGSVAEAAARHVERIREIAPHGPYQLLGWSSGGVVAHAVATRLQDLGERVALLALLDSHPRRDGDRPPAEPELLTALLRHAGVEPAGDTVLDRRRVVDLLGADGSAFAGLDEPQRCALAAVSANNLRIDAVHRPAVFDGDVLLFSAEDSHDGADTAATWAPHVAGEVELHRVRCRHEDITRPGPAALVGATLAGRLLNRRGEATVVKDHSAPVLTGEGDTDYARYMRTDALLSLQRRPEDMVHRDELMFQTVHQSTELWLKHACFEVDDAAELVGAGDFGGAARLLARAALGVRLVTDQLEMMLHLSPWEFQTVRTVLGHGSGYESPGWRAVQRASQRLARALDGPLARVDLAEVYQSDQDAPLYRLIEAVMDWDERIALWRTRHYKIATRIIGHQVVGTQGTPVEVLTRLINHTFFPELWRVRTELTRTGPMMADPAPADR